jgi:4-amino-4-deoxy-L-arabinose transferase-like glycosyltransferase
MVTSETQIEMKEARNALFIDCALLLVLWIFCLACTMPGGNFPLNDDWNYARSVKAMLDEHRLIITQWSLAASLPHIILGWLVCSVFGFSFDALRAISMVGGYVSGVVAYLLCRRMQASRAAALLGAAVLLTNPVFFNVATTFMTDVPFLLIVSILFLYLARQLSGTGLTWSGSIFTSMLTVLTCLTRQTGLVVPVGFLFSVIAARKYSWRDIAKAALPAVTGVASVYLFQTWLMRYAGELASYRVERAWLEQLLAKGPVYVMANSMSNLICALIYLGLFLLPLLIAAFPPLIRSLERKQKRLAIIMFVEPLILIAIGLLLNPQTMPLADNILFDLGLGPILLGGDQRAHYATAPRWFWVLVTVFGVIGASALLSTLFVVIARERSRLTSFLLWVFFLYLAVISFRGFFDRYLIFPLFILIPIVAASLPTTAANTRVLKPLAWLTVFSFAVFAIAGTHDYFAWNRARWQAAHDLVDVQGVSAMEIDGGWEFNGWYSYEPQFRDVGGVSFAPSMRHGDEYILAMQPMSNYEVVSRYSFQRWLPWGGGEILVLREVH